MATKTEKQELVISVLEAEVIIQKTLAEVKGQYTLNLNLSIERDMHEETAKRLSQQIRRLRKSLKEDPYGN